MSLQTDYIDLFLIHEPFGDYYGSYRALEKLQKEGKVLSIGISNFDEELCKWFLEKCRIKPQVNQIETHIYFQEKKMNQYLKKENILHEAWAPFAEGYMNVLQDKTIKELSKKYHKTPAQIMLRYWIQKDLLLLWRRMMA